MTGQALARSAAAVVTAVGLFSVSACQQAPPPEKAKPTEAPKAESTQKPSRPPGELFDQLSASPSAGGSRAAGLVTALTKPDAASKQIDAKGVASTPALSASDLRLMLPPPAVEVPHIRIGWWVNAVADAYRTALDQKKALVLVIGDGSCQWCVKQITNVLRCPNVERFAGDAAFAYSFVGDDGPARSIAEQLDVKGYPTTTVLEPMPTRLLERGRINGYLDAAAMGRMLETILWEKAPLGLEPSFPAIAPLSGSPATAINAIRGALDRSLTHRPPRPDCSSALTPQ